jgi:hypothetical protein
MDMYYYRRKRQKMLIEFWWGSVYESGILEDHVGDDRAILRCISV